jgi:hypothetical protein
MKAHSRPEYGWQRSKVLEIARGGPAESPPAALVIMPPAGGVAPANDAVTTPPVWAMPAAAKFPGAGWAGAGGQRQPGERTATKKLF